MESVGCSRKVDICRARRLPHPPTPLAAWLADKEAASLDGLFKFYERDQRLAGGRYALAVPAARSAIPLNSAPVQALTVMTLETVPDADTAMSEAITDSASLASEMTGSPFRQL